MPNLQLAGNVVFVDAANGNDGTGARGEHDRPFLTLEAALAATGLASGDVVFHWPGTYDVAAGITPPAGVTIKGLSSNSVTIQILGATADTTLLALSENVRIEDVTLRLTSAEHHALTLIKAGGTTTATAKVRRVVGVVDNGGAGAGNSDVVGLLVQSTGAPSSEQSMLRACSMHVTSTGGGVKRGLLMDTLIGSCFVDQFNIRCEKSGAGAGTYYGVEVNKAAAVLRMSGRSIDGADADVSNTAGMLELGGVRLVNGTANGKSFFVTNTPMSLIWCDDGAILGGVTRFMKFGTGVSSVSEASIKFKRPTIAQKLSVRAVTGPGGEKTDVFTVRKNIGAGAADTALTASLIGAATSVSDDTHSVDFPTDSEMSMKVISAIATGTSETCVDVELY